MKLMKYLINHRCWQKLFDFSKEIKIACKDSKLSYGEKNEIVSPVERLWDYNRKTIGRDLGM